MADILAALLDRRSRGPAAVLVTVVEKKGHGPAAPPARMLADGDGRVAGTVGGGAIEKRALDDARAVLADGEPRLRTYLLSDGDPVDGAEPVGMACGGRVTLFYERIAPARRAYLFGAGHIGLALIPLLESLGWAPVPVDCRPDALRDAPLPCLAAGPDYRELPELPELARAAVVIATHGHACDRNVLAELLRRGERPAYTGLVASARKWRTIGEELRAELGPDLDLSAVYAPAGLRLGGGSPAEIALSIAAEIQAVTTGAGRHDHMRDVPGGREAP